MRLGQLALTALTIAGVGGGYAAAFGWHDGVFLLLAWALLTFAWHLIAGIYGYRHAMAREWPRVAPLEDDDWDDD
jgi:phage shock protein PspC (stress-responsive transcriptional regulator)